jgi:hypothetical protein
LREYFPAALAAFDDLAAPEAVELLAAAPDPERAARLSRSKISAALTRARRRNVAERAELIQSALRTPALRQPAEIQSAFSAITTSELQVITTLTVEITRLGEVVAEHFGRHRDAEIYASQPGIGVTLGARILDEILRLPPIQARLRDPERRGDLTDRATGRDQIKGSPSELGRVGLGHGWLLSEGPNRASLPTTKSGEAGEHHLILAARRSDGAAWVGAVPDGTHPQRVAPMRSAASWASAGMTWL